MLKALHTPDMAVAVPQDQLAQMSNQALLMQTEPSEATSKLLRLAGGCTAPHLPSPTMAMMWHQMLHE